jgi:hypothetical protein
MAVIVVRHRPDLQPRARLMAPVLRHVREKGANEWIQGCCGRNLCGENQEGRPRTEDEFECAGSNTQALWKIDCRRRGLPFWT